MPLTDPSLPFSERLRLLREERSRTGTTNPVPTMLNPDGTAIGMEDFYLGSSQSSSAQDVNNACDSISILEVYTRLSKNKFANPRGAAQTGEGIMISCPDPQHTDSTPSAWITTDKGQGGLYTCGPCGMAGGDKYAIAAFAYGLKTKTDFWQIKTRLARDLRGVEYRTPAPSPLSGVTLIPDAGQPSEDPWETAVEEQATKRLVQLEGDHRARQRRSAGLFTPPPFIDDLRTQLLKPDPVIEWTIGNLHSVGGNTTITAGYKTGKTTLVMNLIKALADQEPFLGEHKVRAFDGRIAYWNFEVEHDQTMRTLREMEIRNASRIWHLPLRGFSVNLMDDAAYAWALAEMKRQEIEVWVLDPFSGAYYGDENDNSQINAFTKRLDELKREAGIKDLFMPVHTGRYIEEGNERARGGAKLDDWTDNRWVLAKHSATGDRYLKAEGRRVAQEERELQFQRGDNSLVYSAFSGTRKHKAGSVVQAEVLAFVESHPGCSGREIEAGVPRNAGLIRAAVKKLIGSFDVETRPGTRKAILHYKQGSAPP